MFRVKVDRIITVRVSRLVMAPVATLLIVVPGAFVGALAQSVQSGAKPPVKTTAATKPAPTAVKKPVTGSAQAATAAAASLATSSAAAGSKLVWQTDLAKVMKAAKDQNKLILVDVYTDWCGWCHKLDRDTYSNPDVVTFVNNQFVCLKVDAEDGGPGQAFSQQYQIGGFPCIMMLDAAGKMKGVFYGYRNAAQFPDAVKTALQKGPPEG